MRLEEIQHKVKDNIIGVYQIKNLITNKYYIGSSILSLKRRGAIHKCKLIKGNHHSNKLQNSFNKYGINNFDFEIIEKCNKENCIEREQYYIDLYDSYNNGYNCLPFAKDNGGRIVTQETRDKIRNTLRGRKRSPMSREAIEKQSTAKYKIILQYDLNMNFIKEFKSQKEAMLELNVKQTTMSQWCNNKHKCKNFIFKYKNE